MKLRSFFLVVIFIFWGTITIPLGSNASAKPVRTENVTSELISETIEISPGQTFWVGLHQILKPHWHTYWKNPGDSGEQTEIFWKLPEGFSASEIYWPTPKRIVVEHLTNFGFEDEYVLLSQITAPANLSPGKTFKLQALAQWLVCEDICIPEQADLSLTLTVTSGIPATDPIWAELIENAVAQQPQRVSWAPILDFVDDRLTLGIEDKSLGEQVSAGNLTDIFFYPEQEGLIDNAAPQLLRTGRDGIFIELEPGFEVTDASDIEKLKSIKGVLVLNDKTGKKEGSSTSRTSFQIAATLGQLNSADIGSLVASAPSENGPANLSLIQAILFGILGGLILNLMPCVFPILSMKALNFAQKADKELSAVRAGGLAYTLGVILSFLILASILFSLRAAGDQVGLGFQLQSPTFVAVLAYLMFLIGLNLSGVFEIHGITSVGSRLADHSGLTGSFFTGVLAVIVATPCTAPFMAAALGFTLTQPVYIGLLVFFSLGFGMALPYLALTFSPTLIRLLPKPGPWMETFRQVLAFPMYATAAWLVWVVSSQIGQIGLGQILTGFVILGFAAWLLQKMQATSQTSAHPASTLAIFIAIGGAIALASFAGQDRIIASRPAGKISQSQIAYQPYSVDQFNILRAQGTPLFVNFTADWCITCKVNEKIALNTEPVVTALTENGYIAIKGDWTSKDAAISKALNNFGRIGVPLYVIYPEGVKSEPIILPQILSESLVLSHLRKNGSNKLYSAK